MLIKRAITGIIGMIITVFIVNYGGMAFSIAVTLLALIAWNEFYRAFKNLQLEVWFSIGYPAIALLMGCAWLGNMNEVIAVLSVVILMILGKVVLDYVRFSIQRAALTMMGIFYIGLPFMHLLLLRFMQPEEAVHTIWGSISLGGALLWVAFIGTWASDTFAFFSGSLMGKHKLCPNISPGKTVEGLVGGIVGTVISLLALGVFFQFNLFHMAILGLLVALIATLGDLVESSIKRLTGIKDSGQILPGHGGVLDRFDSILFTVPLVYYYVQIFKIY